MGEQPGVPDFATWKDEVELVGTGIVSEYSSVLCWSRGGVTDDDDDGRSAS